MANVTLRIGDDTWAAVKIAAAREGRSANAWIATVLEAVTDPDSAGEELDRVRERLRRAGLLEEVAPLRRRRPDAAAVRAAGRRAGRGRAASEHVIEGRS